jgi:hypothetical protein
LPRRSYVGVESGMAVNWFSTLTVKVSTVVWLVRLDRFCAAS